MKKTIFILLNLFQLYSAIVVEALPHDFPVEESEKYWKTVHAVAEKTWNNMGQWEDNFDIDGGRVTIYHGENWISMVSNMQGDASAEISQYQGQCQEIYLTHWQGKTLMFPLHLKWRSTPDEFVNQLIHSGFYSASAEEKLEYRLSLNWTMSHSVIKMGTAIDCYGEKREITSVEHTPFGIALYHNECKIQDGFTFLKLLAPSGRVLYAHLNQSPRVFKEVLIEAGYTCFHKYPAYTMQEEVSRGADGKLKRYFWCCYWGISKAEENPFAERLRLEQEELEQQQIEKAERIAARNRVPVLPSILKTTTQKPATKRLRNVRFNSDVLNNGYEEEKTPEIADHKSWREVRLPNTRAAHISRSNISRMKPNINLF